MIKLECEHGQPSGECIHCLYGEIDKLKKDNKNLANQLRQSIQDRKRLMEELDVYTKIDDAFNGDLDAQQETKKK